MDSNKNIHTPQVKICGLTRVNEALECVSLGADAIGCVFFPKSPRHLTRHQARDICLALPSKIKTVGVFVNETYSNIMRIVDYCGLHAVQLHGQESAELINRLRQDQLLVIKALFIGGQPTMKNVVDYDASAFLVECSGGRLPGGNALTWNWGTARDLGSQYPLILAGGLNPDNVTDAIAASEPDAVDVSSAVESTPGRKDPAKVKAFIQAVSHSKMLKTLRRIF